MTTEATCDGCGRPAPRRRQLYAARQLVGAYGRVCFRRTARALAENGETPRNANGAEVRVSR